MTDLDKAREEDNALTATKTDLALTSQWEVVGAADALIAALEDENEALKCCGNCEHLDRTLGRRLLCELMSDPETFAVDDERSPWSGCHFTPSRWQRRQP